jgi:hypothetical protein
MLVRYKSRLTPRRPTGATRRIFRRLRFEWLRVGSVKAALSSHSPTGNYRILHKRKPLGIVKHCFIGWNDNRRSGTVKSSPALSAHRHSLRSARVCRSTVNSVQEKNLRPARKVVDSNTITQETLSSISFQMEPSPNRSTHVSI